MNEKEVRTLFEKWLVDNKIKFDSDVPIIDAVIDYVITLDGKRCAVEAKGIRSDFFNCLGQLINAKRTFSHVYLVAPLVFYKKISEAFDQTEHNDFGYILTGASGIVVIKKANPPTYYVKNSDIKLRKKPRKKREIEGKWHVITDSDAKILETFKDKHFNIFDVATALGISMTYAYAKVNRLRRMNLIKTVDRNNPRTYQILHVKKEGEVIKV